MGHLNAAVSPISLELSTDLPTLRCRQVHILKFNSKWNQAGMEEVYDIQIPKYIFYVSISIEPSQNEILNQGYESYLAVTTYCMLRPLLCSVVPSLYIKIRN